MRAGQRHGVGPLEIWYSFAVDRQVRLPLHLLRSTMTSWRRPPIAKLYVCFVFEAETRLPTESCLFRTARGVAARSSASDATASLFTEAPQASTVHCSHLQPLICSLKLFGEVCAKLAVAALKTQRFWCEAYERLSE